MWRKWCRGHHVALPVRREFCDFPLQASQCFLWLRVAWSSTSDEACKFPAQAACDFPAYTLVTTWFRTRGTPHPLLPWAMGACSFRPSWKCDRLCIHYETGKGFRRIAIQLLLLVCRHRNVIRWFLPSTGDSSSLYHVYYSTLIWLLSCAQLYVDRKKTNRVIFFIFSFWFEWNSDLSGMHIIGILSIRNP